MNIRYPPGYETTIGRRTDEQILAELDRRTGYVQGEVRIIDPSEASPPPGPRHEAPTKFVHISHIKRRPVPGFKGGCGRNSKAGKGKV